MLIQEADQLKLTDIRIVNFRAIKDVTIRLHPQLTILIGDNATGKTTVLDAIATVLWPLIRRFAPGTRSDMEVRETDFRAEASDSNPGDLRRTRDLCLWSSSTIGVIESHYKLDPDYSDYARIKRDHGRGPIDWVMRRLDSQDTAPILAYYGENRGQLHKGENPFRKRTSHGRHTAYRSAFANRVYLDEALDWFEEAEAAELRDQREHGPEVRDGRLAAVRDAIEKLVPEVSGARMLGQPPKLAMTLRSEGQGPQLLFVDQLSSGFRVMVALGMDLARRMADLNPHLPDPNQSPGVVLIDEIDLHLHPRWQQLVVQGLLKAFPNVQFIMTTHSPQVLTTLREENVIKLNWDQGNLVVESIPSTDGAESGRLLSSAMGVSQRPPASVSVFVAELEEYLSWLRRNEGDAPEARDILRKMHLLSPDDPVLATLELEQRRLAARRG